MKTNNFSSIRGLLSSLMSGKLFGMLFLLLAVSISASAQTYPPSCVVTAPHTNAYYQQNTDMVINVYSTDKGKSQSNGSVTKVEFFVDGTKVGESTTQTNNIYTFTWKCVQTGEYRLTARATNSSGVAFTSVGQYVTVGTKAVVSKGMSSNKGKYLANIIPSAAQTNYNTYWNGVTAENSCKWGSVEGTKDKFNWNGADVSYNHAKDNNMMFRYHAALWAAQYPSWLLGLSTADARAQVVEYMKAIATRYKYIDQIDVLNEQLGNHQKDNQQFRDLFSGKTNCSPTDYSWQVWLFEQARAIFPDTKLVLNDYGLENSQGDINTQLGLIKELRNKGLIDGFGSQAHCFNIDGLTAAQLKSSLDLMTNGGIPIYVTELDLNGKTENENNQAVQLASFQTHFPVYWDHPAVAGISIWGYISGATWIGGTGLLQNGTEKSALTWLKSYVTGKSNVGYPFNSIPGSCCATAAPTVATPTYVYKVGATATKLSATGSSLKWYLPDGTSSSNAPTPSTAKVGTYSYGVTQTGSCESSKTNITVTVYAPQAAYGGTPKPIPGKIEFEEFDEGGLDSAYYDTDAGSAVTPVVNYRTTEDVDIETCTDAGAGYNLGYTKAGEWTEYTVNVAAAGKYNLDLRVACNADDRTLSLQAKGVSIVKDVAIPNTAGWQAWQTLMVKDVVLDAGVQIIRMTIGASDYVNLNYMTFTAVSVTTPPTLTITAPVAATEFTTAQTVTLSATATSTVSTIASVKFYDGTTLLNTDNVSPYTFDWRGMSVGVHEITVEAIDADGTKTSKKVSITVVDAPPVVHLKAGWNLIGCPVSGSTDVEKALSSIWPNVISVKNQNVFFMKSYPAYFNKLTKLDYGIGYYVKVSADCDLDWIVR